MQSQNATRGTPQVTSTAMAMTNAVIKRDDQASTLFLENLLEKSPAAQTNTT